jgi:hypothetical protein
MRMCAGLGVLCHVGVMRQFDGHTEDLNDLG